MCRKPFGSGGKRVMTVECLPLRRSSSTISRMKSSWRDGNSVVVIKSWESILTAPSLRHTLLRNLQFAEVVTRAREQGEIQCGSAEESFRSSFFYSSPRLFWHNREHRSYVDV